MPLDWVWGLVGGLMIGTAAAVFLLMNGRIMGASGLLGGVVDGSRKGAARSEAVLFLAGLIGVPFVWHMVRGAPETHLTSNIAVLIAAGLCVGFGTRLANGCTSGHGVCGISRLSVRGIVATVLYLAAGGLTVLAFRHMLGLI
ncbi:YeeE/YedE family protein [uncultured Litoreibacter sp.]|uniref:YeeE/YedE family protein n=1 Tax=uncultured Litoreibacter sp. TaxID=1392394 RepID=UPI002621E612|nr:YeeE/YedE thiosulfate transporter family protein [uncultured Litoreibacter sp.]